MSTNKFNDVIESVSAEIAMPATSVKACATSLFNNIAKVISEGDEVRVTGFGTFGRTHRAERMGRNPATGQVMKIPEKYIPSFRSAKKLKDEVGTAGK